MFSRLLRNLRHVLSNISTFFVWCAAILLIFMAVLFPALWVDKNFAEWTPEWFGQVVAVIGGLVALFAGLIPAGWWHDRLLGRDEKAQVAVEELKDRGVRARSHDDAGLPAVVVELALKVEEVSASKRSVEERLEAIGDGYSIGVDDGRYVARFSAKTSSRDVIERTRSLNEALRALPSAEEAAEAAGQLAIAADPEAAGRVSVAADKGNLSEV